MHVYLIRHAEAADLGTNGITKDADRPLTAKGQDQCRLAAQALQRHGVTFDKVVTSPLVRARQTADGILEAWPAPAPAVQVCDHLAPGGKARKLAEYLNGLRADAVAAVGHMPDLGAFAAWLIGSKKAMIDFDKGGAALIDCPEEAAKGGGRLLWLVTGAWM